MEIISHRGYWNKLDEKNTEISFRKSFNYNFGTETDIRDYKGHLVISHDIPDENSMSIDQFFEIYNSKNSDLLLALNIKSDGLQKSLKEKLIEYKIKNYFVFLLILRSNNTSSQVSKTWSFSSPLQKLAPKSCLW